MEFCEAADCDSVIFQHVNNYGWQLKKNGIIFLMILLQISTNRFQNVTQLMSLQKGTIQNIEQVIFVIFCVAVHKIY